MFKQCVKFQPHFAALDDENAAKVLREKLASHHIKTEVLAGQKAICELAAYPYRRRHKKRLDFVL